MKLMDDLTAAITALDPDHRLDERAIGRVRAATYAAVHRELDAVEQQRSQDALWPEGATTR